MEQFAWSGEGLNVQICVRHVSLWGVSHRFAHLFLKTDRERFVLRFEVRTGVDEKDSMLS